MPNESIQPEKVTRPYQLLAASFVALIVIDSAFLTAAGLLTKPEWLAALLTIAAVANVPIFLVSAVVLQTKFRAEMQDDPYYSTYLSQKREVGEIAAKLQAALVEDGADPQSVALLPAVEPTPSEPVRQGIKALEAAVKRARDEAAKVGAPVEDTYAAYELAAGYMAAGEWQKAATKYEEYLRENPDDWSAHFVRGVALVNSRQGTVSDVEAVRAYNEAIALAGESVERDMRAKMLTYRGAVLKRLGRLDESESDLLLARKYAVDREIIADNTYNLAGIYSLRGEREKLLASLRELQGSPQYLNAVRAHRHDYFRGFANDPEFISLLGKPAA